VGNGGGQVRLTASGTSSATAWITISTSPAINLVAPVLTSGSRAVVRNRQPLVRALLTPDGSAIDTLATVLKWRGEIVTGLARANRGVVELDVDSTRWVAVGDSALIEVTACAQNALCNTVTRWAVLPNDDKPVLGFTGMALGALGRRFGAAFGPGLSVSGADIETGFGTPAYFSLGRARGAGLVYSTRQSYPRALVAVDLELAWPAGTPDQITLTLFDGATQLDALVLTSPTCATGAARRCRAVLQGDFSSSSFSTPTRKWLTVEARVTSGATTQIAADSVEVVLVDRRSTIYGSGWWPADVPKLVPAGSDRVLVGPTGAAAVYRGNGDSLYVAPPGDFAVLKKVGTGWELSPRGSTAKLVFDANGRLVKSLDQNGNRDSIVYNGASDQVTSFRDPVGKAISFGYDGNGKLSTITDPGSRQSRVVIDAATNQLTYDSLSSPAARSNRTTYVYQTYPGTNTVVLTKRIGVITDTTIVTYDSTFKRRPTQVRLPQVKDENGNTVNPLVAYTAYERQGYGALRSLDSVYVEMRDPRSNWTRSLLNRWGQARKTWDSLGVVGRTEYTPEGFVLWSEGKVPDSSRVYHTYDALRRLTRSYIVRAANDTLRLDSLAYDANHRVIKRIDARGKRDSVVYDANGNVLRAITPNDDTTKGWYRTDGLADSVRTPGNFASRKFVYDAVWRNLMTVVDESGVTLDSLTLDAVGRDSLAERKAWIDRKPTLFCPSGEWWGWRRREVLYSPSGQVDSVQYRVANTCDSAPPSWSAPQRRVGMLYDRAGRDSLRLPATGGSTLYLYDRLGRVVSRRPWVDSMAVRDSFVYDVAGNVKKTITRRGDVITTNYDSRNRDTLTVIPGVGTLRKTFAGPLDQLTRQWVDSPVDSIGGVNAELRWGYDQRGRVMADTSYTGTIARATSYAYDAFERLVTRTDPLGAWATRYETNRGHADTLLTPMGDSITYAFDARSRPVGPDIRGGGPLQDRDQQWRAAGPLSVLAHTVATAPSFVAGRYEGDNATFRDEPFAPVWTEQHGAGAPVDALRDTLTYDSYGRVTSWVARKNGTLLAEESYTFSAHGDISSGAGETYDAATRRLVSRTGWTYGYDRAGNLIQAVGAGVTWVYGYDALNRLRSVRYNATLIARYGYDVLGRRIAKRVYASASGGTVAYTQFVYHGDAVAFETDSAGAIGLRYTWGRAVDDLLAIRDAAGNHYYVVLDRLRNTRGLIKRDGTWVASWRYAPYGAVIDSAGSAPVAVRYRWTGREYDSETGFYFFRTRYYEPGVRRFVQEDAIGYAGGTNLYAYGEGRPLRGRDPDGMVMMNDDHSGSICGVLEGAFQTLCGGGRGGGGGGDWNGDGLDDWFEFTEYSWGKQQWLNAGGTIEQWHSVWAAITSPSTDERTRDRLLAESYFGRIKPYSNPNGFEDAQFCGLPGGCTAGGKHFEPGDIMLNTNRFVVEGFETTLWTGHQHYTAWVLAHEVYHLNRFSQMGLSHWIGLTEVERRAEEAAASNFATRMTGWSLEALYPPIPKP